MPEIEVNGARVAYDEHGSGPPLVLVHGLGGNRKDLWKDITAGLAQERRVIACDLRGSGESAVTPGPYTIDLLADDLGALIDQLELEQVVLAGHSMGGAIALTEAARRPARAAAVVGVGATVTLTDEQRQGMRDRAEAVEAGGMGAVAETVATNGTSPSFRERSPHGFQDLVSMLGSADPAGYAAQCRALATMAVEQHLAEVTAPVLLVTGELDKVSPPSLNREIAGRIPNAGEVIEVTDCAHLVPLEQPERLLGAMRSFLAR